MAEVWDWSNDRSFLEWLSELIGIRIGVAVADENLRSVVERSMLAMPDRERNHYKAAHELLGRSALEAFGLAGAVEALHQSAILDVRDIVGDYGLAIRAVSFVVGRTFNGTGTELLDIGESEAVTARFPLRYLNVERGNEIVCEAFQAHGGRLSDVVKIAIERINFHALRSPVPWGNDRVWKDVLDLSELFASESVAASYGKFFDQRFINYLANNFEEIGSVNWRKFEALVAEYFDRAGFEVQLGAGRNDNGVDLRVWESGASIDSTPPTLIVQCKRERRKIQKVVVKALAADVTWEGAQQGLLVATADWSPGAREVVTTRGYPVTEVNKDVLRTWLLEMRDTEKGLWLPQ
ncbi:restriction endonuclease [Streptomyces griseorubiginosus]|uniref:restriction endonuclease n=1 Tax=Streptomyces griseorubiginosus TaxID=67304 RepID=UPI00362EEC98